MIKLYVTSLGCKLNQAEMDALARQAEQRGLLMVDNAAQADWAVVNTCTVTHVADRKSRRLLRHLQRANPGLKIAVTGCYAEMQPDQVSALGGIDLVVPNASKDRLLDALTGAACPGGSPTTCCSHGLLPGRTRSFVKIQDGCDHRCAYCIVTEARGSSRSVRSETVFDEVRTRLDEGYQEIVLTGVNMGAYGRDRGPDAPLPASAGWTLARLLGELLGTTDVRRLRVSSIEPQDLSRDLLELWREERLCPHVHLPLQSGCDETLRRMRRPYPTTRFAELVASLRATAPRMSITTDVMVGFPGEDEAEFEASYAFCQRMAFSRMHVFTYSRRPGTAAAQMADPVDPRTARARSERMIALGRRMALQFHEQQLRQPLEVLFESAQQNAAGAIWSGLTDNYVRVTAPSDEELANILCHVRGLSADAEGVLGEIVACERH